MSRSNQMWKLVARPEGLFKKTDFEWSEQPLRSLADGEVLVRSIYLSLDPTNRIWASEAEGYLPPVELGTVMRGMAVGVVEDSKHSSLKVGDLVQGMLGWQTYYIGPGSELTPMPKLPFPLEASMAVLNHIGATAYFGLLEIGDPKPGETVFVSAAAGAVGSLVGQIAKLKECRVVGLASTDEKCAWLTDELGFDGAINRKTEDISARLDELCPKGIDIYFDNVGGKVLDIALGKMRLHGRVPLCGLISGYNERKPPPGPANFPLILIRRLRVEGFIILDYIDRFMEALTPLGGWIAGGQIKYRLDKVAGLENAPEALNRLFTGDNIGKLAVQVSPEPGA